MIRPCQTFLVFLLVHLRVPGADAKLFSRVRDFIRRRREEAECPPCNIIFSYVHRIDSAGTCVDRCAISESLVLNGGWKCGECPPPAPSGAPSLAPSAAPSLAPSAVPSLTPSMVPSMVPSDVPSMVPSTIPSTMPSDTPSQVPTMPSRVVFDNDFSLVNVPESSHASFYDAAMRWESVIVGDIPDIDTSLNIQNATLCEVVPGVIDDLFVCPRAVSMDGKGGLIAMVNVEWQRASSGLPIVGRMDLDEEDIGELTESGDLFNVVLYGLGHLYGISSVVWEDKNITEDCEYMAGLHASAEWQNLTGCPASVPIPIDDESCSNWDEKCLQGEIMNNDNIGGILSRMTVGALEDLGYEVDYTAADDYDLDNVDRKCLDKMCKRDSGRSRRLDSDEIEKQQQQQQQQTQSGLRHGRRLREKKGIEMIEILLEELTATRPGILESGDDATYTGDKVILALFQEGKKIRGVTVRNE